MSVTVLSGPERRRRWSSAEKLAIVQESLAGLASVADVARRHGVHPNLLHAWRRQTRAGKLVSGADGGCRFAPVMVAPGDIAMGATRSDPTAEPVIEVVLRNGRVLRLPASVAPARGLHRRLTETRSPGHDDPIRERVGQGLPSPLNPATSLARDRIAAPPKSGLPPHR